MGQHWIKDIIDNKNAVSGLSEELVSTANEAAENLKKIISEGDALTNHKERLDALDTKVSTNTDSIADLQKQVDAIDTSNFVTLDGSQQITGAKTFNGSLYVDTANEVFRIGILGATSGHRVTMEGTTLTIGETVTATYHDSELATKDDISDKVSSSAVSQIVACTQGDYDALETKDENVLYIITG